MLRAVLFDFSGTLVHCGDRWWQLEVYNTASLPLELLRQRGVITISDDDLTRADELYQEMRRKAKETGFEISAQEATRRAALALGIRLPEDVMNAAIDDLFRACLPDIQPVDGAIETLATLHKHNMILAVISNARHGPFVSWALEYLGMRHFFHTVVVSADVGLRKPRPEIFWNTLAGLGVAPHEAAFVGDYHPYDMVGAQAAGLFSIWLVEPGKPRDNLPADLTIERLTDLIPALFPD